MTHICRANLLISTTRIGLLLSAFHALQPVFAEDLASAESNSDIIVTALKRSTTLQDTPLAITALSGEDLLNTGTTNITDIARMAPGLRIQDNGPGQRRLSLRGILSAGEPTVGLYYDETPIAGSVGTGSDAGGRTPDFSLFDVERIEVLRGPQGTLYGASSTSGAIRVIMNRPKFDYEATVDGSISSTEHGGFGYNVNGMLNGVVVDGLLAARAVIYRRDMEGYVDNVRLGQKNINDTTVNGGRLMLRLTPSPAVTIDGSVLIENTHSQLFSWNPDVGKYKSQYYIQVPYRDRSQIYNLTGRWDLGPVSLTGISSYQHRSFLYTPGDDSYTVLTFNNAAGCQRIFNNGVACTPTQMTAYGTYLNGFIPAVFQNPGSTKDWTYELRLSSNGDSWINWTAGAFVEDRKNHVDSQDVAGDLVTGAVKSPRQLFYHRYVDDHYKQAAGFGELSVKPVDKATITFGTRYYHYDREIRGETDVAWPVISAPLRPKYLVKAKQSGWLFKFNAEYKFTRDLMVYALAAQGVRPGGANQTVGLPAELVAYKGDKLWNYEAGLKTQLLDRHVTFNTAIFQIDWKDMQISGSTPNGIYTYITNVGASRVRGVEVEISIRPLDGLELFSNATYLDAKLTEDQINTFVIAAGRKGDRLPFIPHLAATIGAEYRHELSSKLDFYMRADANYFGASYSEFRPSVRYVKMNEYALANARIGIEDADNAWGAYLFVNNVFDSTAVARATKSAALNSHQVTSATPRTIGLNVRRRF